MKAGNMGSADRVTALLRGMNVFEHLIISGIPSTNRVFSIKG